MVIKKETFDQLGDMVSDANFALKKAKVIHENLTSDYFMKIEMKSFEEVNRYWYVQNYNRGSVYAHMVGDYLEQLEKTIKELDKLHRKESARLIGERQQKQQSEVEKLSEINGVKIEFFEDNAYVRVNEYEKLLKEREALKEQVGKKEVPNSPVE